MHSCHLHHLFSIYFQHCLVFSSQGKKTQEMIKNYLAPFTFLSTESDDIHRLRSYLQSSNPSLVQEAPSCSWSTISSSGFTHISVASSRSKPHHRLRFVAKWNFFLKSLTHICWKGQKGRGWTRSTLLLNSGDLWFSFKCFLSCIYWECKNFCWRGDLFPDWS